MRPGATFLINTVAVELWPAWLVKARRNSHARALATAEWVLRRKREGAFLGVVHDGRLHPLAPALHREPGIDAALAAVPGRRPPSAAQAISHLPIDALTSALQSLGVPPDYGHERGLQAISEPRQLAFAGWDRFRRPLWLLAPAAQAWKRLCTAASDGNVRLEAISGYRSCAYQRAIFERKLARGIGIDAILRVNAAPGFSEHHSGCAIDISAPGEPAADESFEHTAAFAWLLGNAGHFGFRLSFPRGNPHGLAYEPWHWCWKAT